MRRSLWEGMKEDRLGGPAFTQTPAFLFPSPLLFAVLPGLARALVARHAGWPLAFQQQQQ